MGVVEIRARPTQALPAEPGAAATDAEEVLSGLLAETADLDSVPVESHFFDELGLDSLVVAHFCAVLRQRTDLSSVSVKDCYQHPTIRRLTATLPEGAAVHAKPAAAPREPKVRRVGPVVSGVRYHLCGALQLLALLVYVSVAALVATVGIEWVTAGDGAVDLYLRATAFAGASFLGVCLLPIVAKWVLIGSWRREEIPLWSQRYLRFWIVSTLTRLNPMVLFAGSPIYVLYLRALGARIGPGAIILSRNAPVCTDLLRVGAGAVIRKDSFFTGYRAEGGAIRTGPVTVGEGAFVGEAAVLDIDSSLGDRAQLGHASSLHEGMRVPAGERRQGSPATEVTGVDLRGLESGGGGRLRRAAYTAVQLAGLVGLSLPLAGSGTYALASAISPAGPIVISSVLFFGAVLAGLVLACTLPRALNLAIEPGRTYPLYGFHHAVHRAIARLTNVPFLTRLFGDSSYITTYLSCLGYDLSPVEQTGSNFGLVVKHESPFLTSVGGGTMAADGLSIANADYSDTSFRVSRVTIGRHNFVGNYVTYPAAGRTGENCLLATKVMVPVEGETREEAGLLGSPSFEIPRSVQRDGRFDGLRSGPEFRRRLARKSRHNAVTIALFLLTRWAYVLGLTLLGLGASSLSDEAGAAAIAAAAVVALPFTVGYFALVERASTKFRPLRPRFCSIYDPYFWWHERHWKLSFAPPRVLDGTPFKGLAWRLMGVRIGRRVFDDGVQMTERSMVAIGDDCALNARSNVQPHSQEDGTFKSDRVTIGSACTLGVAALVHYGTKLEDGASLAPDSFLMKGEVVPAGARWGMNPARQLPETLQPDPGFSELRIDLPGDLAHALRRLSRETGRPPGALVLTAHARVLAVMTGESEVASRPADTPFEARLDPAGEQGAELSIRLAYRTDLFDANAAERLAGYLVTALRQLAADPDADPAEQSLLSEKELRLQLEELAGPQRNLPDQPFHELFEARAAAHPDRVAALCGDRELTYGELNARANQLGRGLLQRGLRPEGVVAVATERNLEWMAAVLAIFKAGGAYLPIEPALPPDRIAAMVSRAGCELVLTQSGATAMVDRALVSVPGAAMLPIDRALSEGHGSTNLGVALEPGRLAYIYFTSGSTGEPKGAMCEHGGMLNHLFAKIDDLAIGEGDVVAQTAPQSFDISLWQLVSALLVGGRTALVEQEAILDVERFLDTIENNRVNVLQAVPSYLELLVSHLESSPRVLKDLRFVSVTGEPVSRDLLRRWFAVAPGVRVVNAYGLTETSDDTNHEVMAGPPDSDSVPLGPPVSNVRVYVVDERLEPVPLGAPGEIVFSGICVGRGYVNDPERTRLAFLEDPHRKGERLYRSGDYGRWRPDGKLEFLGRRDAQVKVRGFRIEIGEVEGALSRAPGVRAAATVVAQRPAGGKRLVAFYTGLPLEAEGLRAGLEESMPAYMVPSAFHHREELPLTANGKVDRKALTMLAAEVEGE